MDISFTHIIIRDGQEITLACAADIYQDGLDRIDWMPDLVLTYDEKQEIEAAGRAALADFAAALAAEDAYYDACDRRAEMEYRA